MTHRLFLTSTIRNSPLAHIPTVQRAIFVPVRLRILEIRLVGWKNVAQLSGSTHTSTKTEHQVPRSTAHPDSRYKVCDIWVSSSDLSLCLQWTALKLKALSARLATSNCPYASLRVGQLASFFELYPSPTLTSVYTVRTSVPRLPQLCVVYSAIRKRVPSRYFQMFLSESWPFP